MTIRTAAMRDLDRIIRMGQCLQDESGRYEPLLIFNKKEALGCYQKELSNNRALIIVAEEDNGVVGYQYSFIRELDYLSRDNIECTFEAIYVCPEYRGRGIGKKLIRFSEDWAIREWRANRIKANIYAKNETSIMLHVRDGFSPYCIEYIKTINNVS